MEVYDGNGHIRSIYTISINGKISRFIRVTGTYTVNFDCTGTARIRTERTTISLLLRMAARSCSSKPILGRWWRRLRRG